MTIVATRAAPGIVCALLSIVGCDDASGVRATSAPAPIPSAIVPSATVAVVPSASTARQPGPPPAKPTVAALRKAAGEHPDAFDGQEITLEAFFVRTTRKQFGTGEHPRHAFARVDVALEPLEADSPKPDDILACYYPERQWPPLDLQPGDAIVVDGTWSFAQLLAGGWRPSGGELHVATCRVRKGPE